MFLLLSFFLVAFGQGAFIPQFGGIASSIGYALFWYTACRRFEGKKQRFWLFVLWYGLVQGVQISWLCSTKYMGLGILLVYGLVVFLLALQFGFLSFFFSNKGTLSLRNCFGMAGLWTLLEGSRLFLFSGFPWNPSGLALASSENGIQFAAIFGVYGLSFWVIFVNGFALFSLKSWKRGVIFGLLACTPYLYGTLQEFIGKKIPPEKTIRAALIQTGILPEEKDPFPGHLNEYIPPLVQWERIWDSLVSAKNLDLIVLPEAAISVRASHAVYPIELVEAVWEDYFGSSNCFPNLEAPFGAKTEGGGKVSNLFLAQALANHFNARVIAGFIDREHASEYNAAYDLTPKGTTFGRYEKRVLVPMGEYVPFSQNEWVANFLADQFGVADSFSMGKEPKVFFGDFPLGISICAEETYSHLIRDLRKKGARLFVNLTNDIWFPGTHLPQAHLQHGCIRSAENGVCAFRSCNSGVTAFIDCFGKVVSRLDQSEERASVLFVEAPVRAFKTLYSFWGDPMIFVLSGFFFLFSFFPKKYNCKKN